MFMLQPKALLQTFIFLLFLGGGNTYYNFSFVHGE